MAVVAVLVAATAAAVPATAKATASLPMLRGLNVFAGSSSGTMLLRLARPVHLTISDIAVRGRGRFYGLVLEQDLRDPWAGVTYVDGRFCTKPGCPGPTSWGAGGPAIFGSGFVEGTLPTGVYRAYLVADNAPVRVTLRLPGLSGRATLHPGQRLRPMIATPTPTQAEPANGPLLFAAGSTRSGIGRRGTYVVQVAWKDEPLPHEWTAWANSFYLGRPPSGPTPAYQQGAGGNVIVPIVGGNNESSKSRQVAADVSAPYYISSYYTLAGYLRNDGHPLGQVSVGVSANTDGPVYDAHYSVLWFDRQ
jgi:hypothetical protein